MLDEEPVGEIILKNIDWENKHCSLGTSMRSDKYKNKGYGTKAESLALEYAFHELGIETEFADTVLTNARSRHVLNKVGFIKTHRNDTFCFYRCDKANWKAPDL